MKKYYLFLLVISISLFFVSSCGIDLNTTDEASKDENGKPCRLGDDELNEIYRRVVNIRIISEERKGSKVGQSVISSTGILYSVENEVAYVALSGHGLPDSLEIEETSKLEAEFIKDGTIVSIVEWRQSPYSLESEEHIDIGVMSFPYDGSLTGIKEAGLIADSIPAGPVSLMVYCFDFENSGFDSYTIEVSTKIGRYEGQADNTQHKHEILMKPRQKLVPGNSGAPVYSCHGVVGLVSSHTLIRKHLGQFFDINAVESFKNKLGDKYYLKEES